MAPSFSRGEVQEARDTFREAARDDTQSEDVRLAFGRLANCFDELDSVLSREELATAAASPGPPGTPPAVAEEPAVEAPVFGSEGAFDEELAVETPVFGSEGAETEDTE